MRIMLVTVMALLLAACAHQGGSGSRMVIDWDEVERVERAHRAAGNTSEVVWVNYPMRRVSVAEKSADEASADDENSEE